MNSDKTDHEKIHETAHARAEASVYSLNNPYLNQSQKLEVKIWYQLPGDLSMIIFFICVIYSKFSYFSWVEIIAITAISNIIIGFLNWVNYNRKLIKGIYYLFTNTFVLWGYAIVAIAILVFNEAYWEAVLVFLFKLFLSPILEPHLIIYSFLSQKFKMHPKYAFFKRYYGTQFPFEKDL